MNLHFPLKINESLKRPWQGRCHLGSFSLLHFHEQREQLLLRPGRGRRGGSGEFQRLFPAWGWELAPKPRVLGKDPLVEFRALAGVSHVVFQCG